MLRQKSILYRLETLAGDVAICGASIVVTCLFIYYQNHQDVTAPEFRFIFLLFAILSPSATILLLYLTRVYESLRLKTYFEIFLSMVQAMAMVMVFMTAIMTLLGAEPAGILTKQQREVMPLHWMVLIYSLACFLLLLGERTLIKYWLAHLHLQTRNVQRILIVGTGERAQRLKGVIEFHKHWGLQVVGFVTIGEEEKPPGQTEGKGPAPVAKERIIGGIADIADIIDKYIVDEVVFAVSLSEAQYLEKAIEKCEEVGIMFHLVSDFLDTAISKVEFNRIGNIPLITFSSAPHNMAATVAKRIFDLAVSGFALLVTSIVTVPMAIIIKLTSKGPLFFRQKRVGLNGRVFTLFKFRSMVAGAEKMQKELMDQNIMSGPVFKIQQDPRVTPIGRFMRKWSIDELPQLLNVFAGHMSIVGPRPLPTYEVAQFQRWQRRRLSMRPGLTCLWQVEGRSKITDFGDWMKLDLQYIDNWTFGLDLKIFLKTIPAVLFSKGAH